MTLFLQLYFFLLPFQFALAPVPGIDLAVIRLVTLGLFLVWVGRGLLRGSLVIPTRLPLFFLSGFFLLAALSFFWSGHGDFALRKNLFLLSFLPIFVVLFSWFEERPRDILVILKALAGGAFLASGTGLLFFVAQFVFGVEVVFSFLTRSILPFFLGDAFAQAVAAHPSLLVNISGATVLRASGLFPDPHMFAFYLGMAAPVALALFFLTQSKEKTFWGIAFGSILLADLLAFSRGGYVGLFTGMVVWALFSGVFQRLSRRQRGSVLLGALAMSGVFFFSPVGTRFFSSFSQTDGSNVERLRLWREAVGHIAERPLLGVGLGNYATLVNPGALPRDPIYAHNLFLDITVEVGLIGLFFFLGLVVLTLLRVCRIWRKERDLVALSVAVSLIVFLTHSFFETPLFSVHVLPVFLLLLAVGVSYRYERISR